MLLLIRYELIKTFRKWRTYIGFILVAALTPLVYWGLSFAGDDIINSSTRGLQNNFLFVGTLFNGWFVSHMVMRTLYFHIPLLIVLVAGDIFAGEATSGTFRILMTRPPSRNRIFSAKLLSTAGYVTMFIVFIGMYTIGLGHIVFGGGEFLAVQENGIAIFAESDVWWRFVLAWVLAIWAMCTVAMMGLMFSTLVENAIGPIIGSMGLIIIMLIVGNLPFEFFESLRPYLLTSYFDVWERAFQAPIQIDAILREVGILGIFFVFFAGIAWGVFKRKNVLS